MRRLAILGAGGQGKVVADTALSAGWDQVTFFDDRRYGHQIHSSDSVVERADRLFDSKEAFNGFLVAIGHNRTRLQKVQEFLKIGLNVPTLIHPEAYVAKDVRIEAGAVIFAGAIVQPDSTLGLAAIVNTAATVDHDCSIAAGVHICPGAHLAGGVTVGVCSWIGIGACVNPSLAIGVDATVGAGAAVVENVGDRATVMGVPARVAAEK